MDSSFDLCEQCYQALKEMNIVESKRQFSIQILGSRCLGLFSVICCRKRRLSNNSLKHLTEKMYQISMSFNDLRLKSLAKQCSVLVSKRFEEYFGKIKYLNLVKE
jgi:hypothetical protein